MKTLLIILLSITLLLCGCTQRDYKAEVDALLDCEKQDTQTDKDICLGTAAIIKKDITLCARISVEGMRDNCFHKAATKKADELICGRINLVSLKDNCFYEVAMNKNISAICSSIANKELQESCGQKTKMRTGNLTLCEMQNSSAAKDACYKTLSETQKNISICNLMEDNNQECYATIAERLVDPEICDRIELWEQREDCILRIAEISMDNRICLKLTGPDHWALCSAYTKKDFRKCDLIYNNKLGGMCYTTVAVLTLNETICRKNLDNYLIDCYQKVAAAKNDIKVCDLINGEENAVAKNQCKIGVGQSFYAQNEWKT
jgi:hypothetical protein